MTVNQEISSHENLFLKAKEMHQLGKLDEAFDIYLKLNVEYPFEPLFLNLLAQIEFERKKITNAIDWLSKSLDVDSNQPEVLRNLGIALSETNNFKKPIGVAEIGVTYDSENYFIFFNLAVAFKNNSFFKEALFSINQAIQIKPDYAEALCIKGEILLESKLPIDAFKTFEQVIQINPYLFGDWFYSRLFNCEWQFFEELKDFLIDKIKTGVAIVKPLVSLYFIDDPVLLKKIAVRFTKDKYPEKLSMPEISLNKNHKKIRIGYISADFREHPVSYLTAGIYENHNKFKFEIYAFSLSKKVIDKMQERIRSSFDEFFDCSELSDENLAMFIRQKEIDIAIDLGGFTKGNRPGLFALRVAPIQISFLGFLGTSGANYFDYLIADPIIVTKADIKNYTEKILLLPSYQPNDRKKFEIKLELTRKDLGLKDNSIIFCCFNNNVKISPTIFNSWVRILSLVENSFIMLYCATKDAKENLKQQALILGLDLNRLIFLDRKSREIYLSEIKLADIFLDTYPCSAGTVASDALCAGIPIITIRGNTFASRVCSSVLHAAGLEDLVATSLDQYINLAVNLAKNVDKLKALKYKIEKEIKISRLYDIIEYVSIFENCLEEIYHKHFLNNFQGR
ncbi:MAG: hypothetical protein EB092_05660 [Chitinophagia bacterium]|nr:hypothetical protein [Chitinophagia bacterium]